MRFEPIEDVGSFFTVDTPERPEHGARGSEAIPGLAGLRLWGCYAEKRTWVIAYLPGEGYRASYRHEDHLSSGQKIRVDGESFRSLQAAEAACRRTLKQLRQPT